MLNSFLLAIRFLILFLSGHKQVALENIALRHQLAVFRRQGKRPPLRDRDRLFWIALKKIWKDWRDALEFVQPETVVSWERKRFKRYRGSLSQPNGPRTATSVFGDPKLGPNYGCRQSNLGTSAHPWRFAKTWD